MKTLTTTLLVLFFLAKISFAQLFTEQTDIVIPGIFDGSANWGDFNNDGFLDFVITGDVGDVAGNIYYSALYLNNGDNSFTEQEGVVKEVELSSIDCGDYNNDNYIDILLSGLSLVTSPSIKYANIYRNNTDETFLEQADILYYKTSSGTLKWGDFNNDGYQDIFQSGSTFSGRKTKLQKNAKNGDFYFENIEIADVMNGNVDWGDYNNDGLLDFIYTGIASGTGRQTKVYKNNGDNTFSPQDQIILDNVTEGDSKWGDYNNDGYLDLILQGRDEDLLTSIYKNNQDGSFTKLVGINLIDVYWGEVAWGDYNNDGLLDILLSGWEHVNGLGVTQTKIYQNLGNDLFEEELDNSLIKVGYSNSTWGDYDNDNDLDILLTGFSNTTEISSVVTKIYKNNTLTPNTKPNPITNLETEVVGTDVYFSWDEATDDDQPSAGLNYNIYVYDEDNRENIFAGDTAYEHQFISSPQSFIYNHPLNGKSLVAQRGHIQGIRENGRVSYMLKGVLDGCKKYYWSVQAIDASFAGGEFAPEDSFYVDNAPPYIVCPLDKEFEISESQTGFLVSDLVVDPIYVADACSSIELENNINFTETMLGEELPPGITSLIWTATDSVGNVSECSLDIEITQVISVSDLLANKITVSPNPSKGVFLIKNSSSFPISEFQLSVTDITGKVILTMNQASSQINISDQPNGIYFLRLSHDDFVEVRKLVVY